MARRPVDRQKITALDGNGAEVEIALTIADPVAQVFKTMAEALRRAVVLPRPCRDHLDGHGALERRASM